MKIKLLVLTLTILTAFSNLKAQNISSEETQVKKSEIGVSYTNNGIGLDYRRHLKDNKFLRISNARVEFGGRIDNNIYRLSVGANIGIENRKSIGQKWWINYGPEVGFKYSTVIAPGSTNFAEASFGYFLGINYDLTNRLSIGAEIKPYFYGQYGTFDRGIGSTQSFTNVGISSAAKINLLYRF